MSHTETQETIVGSSNRKGADLFRVWFEDLTHFHQAARTFTAIQLDNQSKRVSDSQRGTVNHESAPSHVNFYQTLLCQGFNRLANRCAADAKLFSQFPFGW